MADATEKNPATSPTSASAPLRILVLQGGGALGSYQAGVYEELSETGFRPEWLAGISIGAINCAIIAGNAPEERLAKLKLFWERASSSLPYEFHLPNEKARAVVNEAAAGWIATFGVEGFFKPRFPPPFFSLPGTKEAISFYDTSPLRATLEELVDFKRINAGETRLSLGATNVRTGQLEWFDSMKMRIGPEHVMASGALPPGFPPIEIKGQHYWDGGVVSNTPLQHVLDTERDRDLLVFQVDLFNAEGPMPRTILEATEREKDIRYASRTNEHTETAMREHEAKAAVRSLLAAIPAELRDGKDAQYLAQIVRENAVTVVKLVYRRKPYEGSSKDYEFSRQTMLEHWASGIADVKKSMAKKSEMTCQRHIRMTKLVVMEEDR